MFDRKDDGSLNNKDILSRIELIEIPAVEFMRVYEEKASENPKGSEKHIASVVQYFRTLADKNKYLIKSMADYSKKFNSSCPLA